MTSQLAEKSFGAGFVTGHDFSRAEKPPFLRIGALQAAEKLASGTVLKGHGFIRADKSPKTPRL
jgi:hypothetical protein